MQNIETILDGTNIDFQQFKTRNRTQGTLITQNETVFIVKLIRDHVGFHGIFKAGETKEFLKNKCFDYYTI